MSLMYEELIRGSEVLLMSFSRMERGENKGKKKKKKERNLILDTNTPESHIYFARTSSSNDTVVSLLFFRAGSGYCKAAS